MTASPSTGPGNEQTAAVKVVVVVGSGANGGTSYWLWCPACEDVHRITDSWGWNGDRDRPTFTPSIAVRGVQWARGEEFHKVNHPVQAGDPIVCHSFVVDGVWQYLGDCTHTMAGQHVPMVDVPAWVAR